MKNIPGIVKQFGNAVDDAEKTIMESISDNRVDQEPDITGRFVQILESNINKLYQVRGIKFKATSITSLGTNAEEHEVGADFLGVLHIQLPGMSLSKGFLCQAKRSVRGFDINRITNRNIAVGFNDKAEFKRLQQQVAKMLLITPDSFVCIYSDKGFAFIPALSVMGLNYINDGNEVYAKNTRGFFSEFMMCFIGDSSLGATDGVKLKLLAEETRSRYALIVSVESEL